MRVRLDAGALARFLGHPEGFPQAPGDLSEDLVIATLDVSPFLVSAQPTAVGAEGYQIASGRGSVVRKRYGPLAAGTEFTVTIPEGEAWRVLLFFCRLVSDATVLNREVAIIIDDDVSNPYYRDTVINGQAASTSWDHSWGIGALTREDTAELRQVAPMPDCLILPGMRFRTNTTNLQAGDQFTVVNLMYERL